MSSEPNAFVIDCSVFHLFKPRLCRIPTFDPFGLAAMSAITKAGTTVHAFFQDSQGKIPSFQHLVPTHTCITCLKLGLIRTHLNFQLEFMSTPTGPNRVKLAPALRSPRAHEFCQNSRLTHSKSRERIFVMLTKYR